MFMKKLILLTLVFVMSSFSLFADDDRSISVTGNGTVTFLPDMVSFSLTVSNENKVLEKAVELTGTTISEVLRVCEFFNIEPKDIKTGYVNVGKRYERKDYDSPQKFVGYTAEQTMQITFRNLPRFERLSAALFELDIDSLYGTSFSHSKMSDYISEAQLIALDDAKERAAKMTERAGVTLGKVLHITNTADTYSAPTMYRKEAMLMSADNAYGGGMQVSPGILSVTQNVFVLYEIR